jgi:sec-independent protein translocase protein TatA
MFGFGWMELLLVLVIVLIVFGAGKLPQLGEGLGKAIKGFKKSVHEPEPQLEAQEAPAQAIQVAPSVAVVSGNSPVPVQSVAASKAQGQAVT